MAKDGSRGSDEDVAEHGELTSASEGIAGDSTDNWLADRGDLVPGSKEIASVCLSNWDGT